ncbi:MAG: hypothetical protein H6748_04575 [Spirochaetaceae bacterium]|nr:hypothetical protein [Spirochaetaceae bacterium]HPG27044.1 hypothetical protein [Myxococcota bacterium]
MKGANPLPKEFLAWQVALRNHTMHERNGAPHIGVVPIVAVRRPGGWNGVSMHSIVCGLLPHERLLEARTGEFRGLYEAHVASGARAIYDAGIRYLSEGYYASSDDFDASSLTSLVPRDCALVDALRAEARCSLVFNVFETADPFDLGKPRCNQLDCLAEVLDRGPVYENVWWHNTLFHGKADEHVVLHFHHQRSWDNRFAGQQALRS